MKISEGELSAQCRNKLLDRINWFSNQKVQEKKVKCIVYLKLWGLKCIKIKT